MVLEVLWTKGKDVKHGKNIKTFVVNLPELHSIKNSRIHVDADFTSPSPVGFSKVSVKVNGFNAGHIQTTVFPNYDIKPLEINVPLKNGVNTVEFDVIESSNFLFSDKVTIQADIFYELIKDDTNDPPIPPTHDMCKICKQLGKLCDGNRCIDNVGKNSKILGKNFIAGAVEGNKPVTHVKLTIDVPIKSGDRIITSNIYTKVNATRVSPSFFDIFYTSLVNISVNNDRIESMNLEQKLFVDGAIKESTKDITLRKGKNTIQFDLDFGQAGLQYNVFSDIYIKTEKGDKVNVKVTKIEEYGTGGISPPVLGLSLGVIALGLGAILLLSTSGGRTVVIKGAKAGVRKLRK